MARKDLSIPLTYYLFVIVGNLMQTLNFGKLNPIASLYFNYKHPYSFLQTLNFFIQY